MTEPRLPLLSIRRKPKIYVNPKPADKPAPAPKSAKPPKAKAPKPVKEPKLKQPPPKPLSREERIARNRAKKLRQGQEAIASLVANWPSLFDLGYPKLLKVGIAADILDDIKARELDLTRAKASATLMFYTQRVFYQQAHALKQLEKWRVETESAVSPGEEPTP